MFTAANDVIFYTCSVICESPYSTSLKPILVMATALPQDPSQHWRVATMSSIVPIFTVNDGVLCATDKDDYIHSSFFLFSCNAVGTRRCCQPESFRR